MTSTRSILFRAGSLLDPGKGLLKEVSLVVSDGVITDISTGLFPGQVDALIDLSRVIVSPPFRDNHLHFSGKSLSRIEEIRFKLISSGIMNVMEGGDKSFAGFDAERWLPGIDVKTCGAALFKRGSYGKNIGFGISDEKEAINLIQELSAGGADYIKVINSGIFDPASGGITPGGFTREELAGIIQCASDMGLPVFCHANGEGAVRDAVLSGASAVIHGFSVSDEVLIQMKEMGVSLIPTVAALSSLGKIYPGPVEKKRIEEFTADHLRTVERAFGIGVKILPGSDSGPGFLPYGTAYLEELEWLKRAGIPPEVLLAAAAGPPLEKGGKASFVALDGLSVKRVFVDGIEWEGVD